MENENKVVTYSQSALQKLSAIVVLTAISTMTFAAEGDAANLLADFTLDTSSIVTFIGVIFAAVVTVGMAWMSVPMVIKGLRAVRSSM